MTITYQHNAIGDLESVFKIATEIFDPTPEEIRKYQSKQGWIEKIQSGGLLITAYEENTPVGFAICRNHDNERLHIWNVGVVPQFRKKGVWKEMYRRIVEHAESGGYKRITLNTYKDLFPSMYSFVQKEGFSCYEIEMENIRGKMRKQSKFELRIV